MIVVSATKLKNNLFEFLEKVAEGESITIQRNGENVAMVIPPQKEVWRDNMRQKIKFLVPPDEAFAPMDDLF